MTSRAPTEPKKKDLRGTFNDERDYADKPIYRCAASTLTEHARRSLANAPKTHVVPFNHSSMLTQAMTVQELYDRVRHMGIDPAQMAILIGPLNDSRGYPIPFSRNMLVWQTGSRGSAVIFNTDGL